MKKSRMWGFLLAGCMLLALLPTTAFATGETAGFMVNGSNSVVDGVFTVTEKGTATLSIASVPYTGASNDFREVALDAPVVITMVAEANYSGSLLVDGSPVNESYCARTEQTAVYSFTLAQLGYTAGSAKNIDLQFQDVQAPPPPPPPTPMPEVPIPAGSILLGLSDNLGNSLSYDTYHNDAHLGVTIQYSYDGSTWNELSNHAVDANCTQAYSNANNGTYTYAFTNAAQVYLRVTAVTGAGGMIQSKALAGYDDGVTVWPGAVTINQSYTLDKKDGSVYDLEFSNGFFTVIWSYDPSAQASMRVDNGTLHITKIDGVDASAYEDPSNGIGNTPNGGFWMIKAGAIVEAEIKPNYGYQFLSGGFNDAEMISGESTSTFTFTMASTPLHFHALFQKVNNTVNAQSQKVQSGQIAISDQEIDSGTVVLSVGDITLSPEQITNFETAAKEYKISSYLGINLDQVLYKGNAQDVWKNELKNLDNPATVTLKLEEGVDGNEIVIVHEKHDKSYEIIPTTYDPVTRTISFTTTSFSNYAIASKTVVGGHTHTLTHFEAKAATATAAGNKEYWYCAGCKKYFSDAQGKNEITLASTVIAATGADSGKTNPQTGNSSAKKTTVPQTGDSSGQTFWISVLVVSGVGIWSTTAYMKKKKKITE